MENNMKIKSILLTSLVVIPLTFLEVSASGNVTDRLIEKENL
jgi:hypothetical protein